MRKIVKHIFTIMLILWATPSQLFAQLDAYACHFWSDHAVFNPANVVPMFNATLLLRGQQIGFKGQPLTARGGVSWYEPNWHSLFGLQLHYDYAGYTHVGKAALRYAFSLGGDKDRVNLGLAAGVSFFDYDLSKVTVDNTNDDYAYSEEREPIRANFSFGVEWVHKVDRFSMEEDEFSLGASIMNAEDYLTSREYGNTINTISGYATYRYNTIDQLDLYGGAIVQYYDTNRLQAEIHFSGIITRRDEGGLEIYDFMAGGLSYKHRIDGTGTSDIAINVGMAATKHLYVGYTFDFVVTDNFNRPFSTHELFLQYRFKNRKCLSGYFGKRGDFLYLGGK